MNRIEQDAKELRRVRPVRGVPGRHREAAIAALERHGLVRENVRIEVVTAPTRAHFDDAHAFLEATLAVPSHRLYTHCRAGIERTATILAACLGRRWRVSFDKALERLREKGWSGNPMLDQREAGVGWTEASARVLRGNR